MKQIFENYCIFGEDGDYSIKLNVGCGGDEDGVKDYTQRTFTSIERWDDVCDILNAERHKLRRLYGQ